MTMTPRDLVAVILAIGLVASLVLVVFGVVFEGFRLTGDGVVGGLVGALVVILSRYVADRSGWRP